MRLEQVRAHPLIGALIRASNEHLAAQGFTEHGQRHAELVARVSRNVMTHLGRSQREAELAEIAGYTHDIGNAIAREAHGQVGAAVLVQVLSELGMDPYEIAVVAGAVGNHEEEVGQPVNPVSAALILADKSDVHKSRVQNPDRARFDIHDRVNYAVQKSFLRVHQPEHVVQLELEVDTSIIPLMEYFEIFLTRMLMCRRAAEFLGCRFQLQMNGVRLL
ncbi:MAG: HD domain-containing protein [Limnochordaceae bacterium]|nr:HD domain-containing protein [Limnochordaceae bacterium]